MPEQTILLIDYDPVTVEYTRSSLTEAGYAVEVAADGISGLECFERIRPDLVVVEAMIPKKHGFEVCKAIKGSSTDRPAIPVVITTSSFSGRKHRNEAINTYGCDEYLEKPIGKQRLVSICRGLLEGPSVESEAPAVSAPLPDLDEMSEDQLTAELDRLVPDVEDDDTDDPLVASDTPDDAASVHDPDAPAAKVVEGPTEAALARLSELTEEEIVSRLENVLSKRASGAGLDGGLPADLREFTSEPADETAAKPAGDEIVEIDEPTRGLPGPDDAGGEAAEVEQPAAAPRSADSTGRADRDVAARVDRAPATAPVVTAVKATARGKSSSTDRPALKWVGIAAGLLVLIAAGWFGLTRLGNGTPGDRGIDEANSAAVTSPREPAPRAALPAPFDTGEFTGLQDQGAGTSTSDLVDFAALGTPTASTRPAIPPDAPAERSGPTRIDNPIAQPRNPQPQTVQPESPPRTTTRSPEPRPAVRVARPSLDEIPAQAGPVETAELRPVPPTSGLGEPVTGPTDNEAISAGSMLVASVTPGDADVVALGSETLSTAQPPEIEAPAAEQDETSDVAVDPLNVLSPEPAGRSSAGQEVPTEPDPPRVAPGSLVPIEEVDSPPVIVTRTQPNYHPFARRLKQQGTVELRLRVDEEGRVAEVEFVRGIPASRLNDEATKAARTWTYEPAMKDGVPVQVWIPVRVEFRL